MQIANKTLLLAVLAMTWASASFAGDIVSSPGPSDGDATGGIVILLLLGALLWFGGRNAQPQTTRDATDSDESKIIMKF